MSKSKKILIVLPLYVNRLKIKKNTRISEQRRILFSLTSYLCGGKSEMSSSMLTYFKMEGRCQRCVDICLREQYRYIDDQCSRYIFEHLLFHF